MERKHGNTDYDRSAGNTVVTDLNDHSDHTDHVDHDTGSDSPTSTPAVDH